MSITLDGEDKPGRVLKLVHDRKPANEPANELEMDESPNHRVPLTFITGAVVHVIADSVQCVAWAETMNSDLELERRIVARLALPMTTAKALHQALGEKLTQMEV